MRTPGKLRVKPPGSRDEKVRFAGLVAAALAVGLLAPLHTSADQEQAPWFGTWRLNPAKSTQRSEPSPYKRVTLRIEPWEDGLKVTYDMVGTRGGVTHLEWTGRFDGKDYAVQGASYVLTNAYRRIDDRTYAIVVKVDGESVATARVVVSHDGRTLTVATTEKGPKGPTVDITTVYERQ
jgi:hypothetical protein